MNYINDWLLFSILFGVLLVISFLMIKLSRNFYTKDVTFRKFSIMELDLPSTPTELTNLITGLYKLSPEQSVKSVSSLKNQLRLDFLFMPFIYGCIFILCWRVGNKMQVTLGHVVFFGLALLQVIPWICDIIENIYLLGKIKPNIIATSLKNHKIFLYMEAGKWVISLTAISCSISAVCYFWLTGAYSRSSIMYLFIVFAESLVFLICLKFLLTKKTIVAA